MRIRFLLVALIAGCARGATADDDLPACPVDGQKLAAGDYLETAYIEILHTSYSPLAAVKDDMANGVAQMVRVAPENNGLTLTLVFNWHEGSWLFRIHADGKLERDADWYQADKTSLDVLNSCSFRLNAPGGPIRTYRYVGSDERYIAKTVLAGTYIDERGRKFTLDEYGNAVFPDRTFRYTLQLDQVLDPYDFFRVGDEQDYLSFRRNGAELFLYPVIPEPDQGGFGRPDLDHPAAQLKRISAP